MASDFIDTDAFKIDINNSIIDNPDLFTYDVLDRRNTFKYTSVNEFKTATQARNGAYELLALLTDEMNYRIFQDKDSGKFLIRILKGENIQAINAVDNNTEEESEDLKDNIINIVKRHQYVIDIEQEPHRWKFNYRLGYEKSNLCLFGSVKEFKNKGDAEQAATLFIQGDSRLVLKTSKDKLILNVDADDKKPVEVAWVNDAEGQLFTKTKSVVEKLLAEKKEKDRLSESQRVESFKRSVNIDEISKLGLFVYRLVDKDRVPAFYTKEFNDKDQATTERKHLEKLFHTATGYLQLCMGGEHLIHKIIKPKTKEYWYHYQLKSLNHSYGAGDMVGLPLVLFESTTGYKSVEEATQAFKENYLYLIQLASNVANYGRKISLEKNFVNHTDSFIKNDSLVFVPKATVEDLGPESEAAIKKLTNLALSYPIRMVSFGSEEFQEYFPCEKVENEDPDNGSCLSGKEEKKVYYFVLSSEEGDKWQSTEYYTTHEETRKEFDFFLTLLHYPGNYYVD